MIFVNFVVRTIFQGKQMSKPAKYILLLLAAAGLFLQEAYPCHATEGKKKVIVLAFDGMDPRIVREMFAKEKLPNFKRLSETGSFKDMWSSIPPQSPVAWSNFITGKNPGGHAIFDFIHRNPATYLPYLSTSETIPPKRTWKVGEYILPLSKGTVVLKREGKAFWEYLAEEGIPAMIFRIPSNFPPVECGVESVSGMGTPDLQGTYGTYQYFTTNPGDIPEDPSGAELNVVRVVDGAVRSSISGPPNSFRKGSPTIKIDFTAWVDPENPVARIDLPGQKIIMEEGEWSDWIVLDFKPLALVPSVKGICRMYLKGVHPHFRLYVSPINIDPKAPALPIDTPSGFAKEIADAVGYFYTQGMPEDTKTLSNDTFTTEEFYTQSQLILKQRDRIFDYLFDRFEDGFFFFYWSSTDQGTHIFWHLRDENHPIYDPVTREKLGDVIEEIYEKMDVTVGKVLDKMDEDTTLLIMSDHGFSPYYKGFNLNTWLLQNGYLVLKGGKKTGSLFNDADWSRTRAYGLGLNSLYINLRGREGKGIVNPGREREILLRELAEKLQKIKDPQNGNSVIRRAHITDEVYSGEHADKAPDIIVGFDWEYRIAWESALGDVTPDLLKVSEEKWSGDHCGATEIVPAILFANKKIRIDEPHLYDLAPTILSEFGIPEPADMIGRNIFGEPMPLDEKAKREADRKLKTLGYI